MDILLRYALADGLNVVLPVSTSPTAFYSHDRLFSTSARYFSLPAWHKAFVDNSMYHIFTMHTRFNVEEIRLCAEVMAVMQLTLEYADY